MEYYGFILALVLFKKKLNPCGALDSKYEDKG